jgi:hypothetical protein
MEPRLDCTEHRVSNPQLPPKSQAEKQDRIWTGASYSVERRKLLDDWFKVARLIAATYSNNDLRTLIDSRVSDLNDLLQDEIVMRERQAYRRESIAKLVGIFPELIDESTLGN